MLAQLVLVSIREGAVDRAGFELSALRALHPDATGRIGGRDVAYAPWLAEELEAASEFAENSPKATLESALDDVYA